MYLNVKQCRNLYSLRYVSIIPCTIYYTTPASFNTLNNSSCIFPLLATIFLVLNVKSLPARSEKLPPASFIIKAPAAISHELRENFVSTGKDDHPVRLCACDVDVLKVSNILCTYLRSYSQYAVRRPLPIHANINAADPIIRIVRTFGINA